MTQNVSFRRKVLYLCVIALLLFPLYMLGRPASGDPSQDVEARPGGTLAQLRSQYDLSQAELGEIDPASESMRLATLGMRGVAANILWTKANNYKRTENWEALVATVNQMAKLQPNFISVWEFQSHNLSYNISVEQDDYRFRYAWVKKGIDFLISGTRYNRREPRLYWNLGWYTGQKFGRADESKQFRRLFRADDEFHESMAKYVDVDLEGRGADNRPDSWLVSRLWYLRAYDLIDNQGASLRGKSPHIFFADGPKSRMNYAATIESEGYLDEVAETAWRKGGEEWKQFGERQVPTSWGVLIRLNDQEKLMAQAKELEDQLANLAPGVREAIFQEKFAKLTDDERAVYGLKPSEITDSKSYSLQFEAKRKTEITDREIAERAPAANRAKAYQIAAQAMKAIADAERISRYRSNVNFDYWKTRCEVEQKPDTVAARRHVYQAKELQKNGELESALTEYGQAWDLWGRIIDENPKLLEQLMADDLYEDVQQYVALLGQLEKRLAPDFKLMPLVRMYGELPEYLQPAGGSAPSPGEAPKEPAAAPPTSTENPPAAAAAPAGTSTEPAEKPAAETPKEEPAAPAAAPPAEKTEPPAGTPAPETPAAPPAPAPPAEKPPASN